MVELHTWDTPNGRKISVALEEMGLLYRVKTVNITKDEQFDPAFLAISPNNKIPAIVDPDGPDGEPISVFESGAILIYLAEKTGRFLPRGARGRVSVLEWLMWQMGGLGPMAGQAHHFLRAKKGVSEYSEERYVNEAKRLYGVLDRRLDGRDFIADEYSIADIASWPWVSRYEWHNVDINAFPNVRRWYTAIAKRPAVQRGYQVPKHTGDIPMP